MPMWNRACGAAWLSLALGAAILALAPSAAWAPSCNVIDFSAVKQRTQTVIGGSTVSTLVASPVAAPDDAVLLEADFGCKVGSGFDPNPTLNTVTVEVQKSVVDASGNGVFADPDLASSFESFVVPGDDVTVLDCPPSLGCNALQFTMPDTGFAGPARITVTRGAEVVARIFKIGTRTASCDVDAPDTLFGTFTLLPPRNVLQASPTGVSNPALRGALAGNGSLLIPLEHFLFGAASVVATATTATGPEIDRIPNGNYLRALNHLGRPLPAIHRLIPFGVNGNALFSTADVERSTLQVLQQEPNSLPPDDRYPDNFHDFRLGVATPGGSAGPVEFPNPVIVKFENASPLVSLRFNEQTVAVGVSEELLGDRNADTDQSDLLLSATDLASGVTTDTGQAIAQVSASPRTPVVAVGGDVVAYLQSEALSGHTDLNGDAEIDDLVARVVKEAMLLNGGAPVNTSADPVRAIDGSQLAISDGFVFFRTAENATAPHTTARVSDASGSGGDDTSDAPSIDAAGARVAYATRAGNLAPGASGAHRQIVVTDLLSGVHALMSEGSSGQGNADSFDAALSADGEHVAFASDAGNLGGGSGGSMQVVWERGVNVEGHSVGPVSFATFELATGEEDVAGVDYSPCTASEPGLSITFAANGSVWGWLGPSSSGACSFFAGFSGTYAIAPAGPIQVGSIITVDAPLTSFDGEPGLPEGLEDLRLFSVNTVTDVGGPLFDFAGTFQLLASAGVASSTTQVYARALDGSVELASAADGGGAGDGASTQPALSGDGALVAFASLAQNLVPGDGNGASDVFVRDLDGSSTARVSLTDGDAEANGASDSPALTPGGGLLAFASDASNLVGAGADANSARDVFVRDLAASSTELASAPAPGGSANGASTAPDLSDDGRFVVFESGAALVLEDTNGVADVYLRDRLAGSTERVSTASGGEQADDGSFDASISGDGSFVLFASLASNLVPGAPPGTNVYRRNRLTGTVELLSEGASAGDTSTAPAANGNGLTVAFDSDASLVLNDSLPVDVFVRASGEGSDLNDDGDDLDTMLQAFAANAPVPGLLPGARVAASFAATGAGRALVGVPEASESNMSRNGDPDALDTVLHLYEGATDVLVNLGVAGVGGSVSELAVCALANEAQQGDLNNDGDATDTVLMTGIPAALIASSASLTNTGIAASQTLAASSLCAFVAADDQVLRFYDTANGKLVSTGLRATRFLVGPDESLIAFRVPETGFIDLNNDQDEEDEVMHLVSSSAVFAAANGAVTTAVSNLGLQGIDCDLPACLALPLGSILGDGSVSFLGTEPGQTRDPDSCLLTNKFACDFNGDADGVDTVVHLVRTKPLSSPPLVTATGTLALSSTFEQQASPFPVQAPNGLVHTLQITECEAAVQGACGSVVPQTGNIGPLPLLTYCESRYDTDHSGALDCGIVRNFVGVDTDEDEIPDWFDPAEFIDNPAPSDIDKDGVDDEIDNDDNSQPPCLKSCDLNDDGCIDQDDVDAILGAVVAGGQTTGGALSEVCSDRRDRDADRKISFLDASLCKADPDFEPDGCPAPPPTPPPTPPPPSAPACGLGIELIGLLPLLGAARKRVSRKEKKFLA